MRLAPLFLAACLFPALHTPALASVVMTGTRVIYPAAKSGQTLQFSNTDKSPYLVQMWLDAGEKDSTADMGTPDVPFALSPPIFRMEPGSGQAVRLMYTGGHKLPDDRESVFYLNFTQIPTSRPGQQDSSQLVMLLNSRLKVFYRPRRLSEPDLHKLACALRFHVQADTVRVENPAAFHAVVLGAELVWRDGSSAPLLGAQMLAPFSQQQWPLPDSFALSAGAAQVRVTLVNDYGADNTWSCPWQ